MRSQNSGLEGSGRFLREAHRAAGGSCAHVRKCDRRASGDDDGGLVRKRGFARAKIQSREQRRWRSHRRQVRGLEKG